MHTISINWGICIVRHSIAEDCYYFPFVLLYCIYSLRRNKDFQMEKVRPWCDQPSDRGRLRNVQNRTAMNKSLFTQSACLLLWSQCFFRTVSHTPAVSYVPPSLVRCFSDLIDMRLGTRRCDSGYQCIVVKATVMYTVSKLTGLGHYSLLTLMSSEVDVKRKCAPNLVNDVG